MFLPNEAIPVHGAALAQCSFEQLNASVFSFLSACFKDL